MQLFFNLTIISRFFCDKDAGHCSGQGLKVGHQLLLNKNNCGSSAYSYCLYGGAHFFQVTYWRSTIYLR